MLLRGLRSLPRLAQPSHILRNSLIKMTTSAAPSVPAYLLHAPFLSLQHPTTPSNPSLLLQRTLPPSPLYYLHPAPSTPPNSLPPSLTLSSDPPIPGRHSLVYRASSPSGAKVVLKYSTDFLALLHEAEEVYVNLPAGVGLPIPTYWGLFEGAVEEGQAKGLVLVLEDCGEALEGGFEALSLEERCVPFPLHQYEKETVLTTCDEQTEPLQSPRRLPLHPLRRRQLFPRFRCRPPCRLQRYLLRQLDNTATSDPRRIREGGMAPLPRSGQVHGVV